MVTSRHETIPCRFVLSVNAGIAQFGRVPVMKILLSSILSSELRRLQILLRNWLSVVRVHLPASISFKIGCENNGKI